MGYNTAAMKKNSKRRKASGLTAKAVRRAEKRRERVRRMRKRGMTYAAIAIKLGGITPQRVYAIIK